MSAALAPEPATDPAPALVPEGGCFKGLLVFRGSACIAGKVEGEVEGDGRLEVRASASLVGAVRVGELVVSGAIEGDVSARERIVVEEGATLRGTLAAPRLAVANGALIQGRCSAGSEPEPSAVQPSSP